MRVKKLITTAVVAAIFSLASAGASALTIDAPDEVSGSSFTNWIIGTITVSSLSNLTGYFYAADSISTTNKAGVTRIRTLDTVSFASGSVGELVGTWNSATASFSYLNVGPGTYTVLASGTLDGHGQISQTAFLSADYTITAVPEPESYAMLLAGLGLMGAIARRRNKASKAV